MNSACRRNILACWGTRRRRRSFIYPLDVVRKAVSFINPAHAPLPPSTKLPTDSVPNGLPMLFAQSAPLKETPRHGAYSAQHIDDHLEFSTTSDLLKNSTIAISIRPHSRKPPYLCLEYQRYRSLPRPTASDQQLLSDQILNPLLHPSFIPTFPPRLPPALVFPSHRLPPGSQDRPF